ncbi:interleukin-18 receptor 1 isoform X2 [Elgaria multicarinata webbii]|uniref:interleukin-18 receptor 1 isoform X2 n=1 Tax=Elgaria multicarinata webbii TaxID=159646 RepID=UPI002FCD476D
MYLGNPSVLLLLIVSFVTPGKLCMLRPVINLLEEEYFSVCCPTSGQEKEYTVNWYRENEGKWMSIQEDGRIDLNGTYLQFWPAVLNDTGKYSCCLSNETHISCFNRSLKVLQRNKESCFNPNHIETGIPRKTGQSHTLNCNHIHHPANVVSITWYKNCSRILDKTEEELVIFELKPGDVGKYTCVKSLTHAGKSYNITRTTELILQDPQENTGLSLIGPEHTVLKTAIGKSEILNCTAFLPNNSFESHWELYWLYNGTFVDKCQDTNEGDSPCEMEKKEEEKYVLIQLWLKSVKEENIHSSYDCILSGHKTARHSFILQKETNPDLSVHVFTTGIIMAILFSFITVFMAILCAVFRVDLVLLYRDITAKDDTLGDGKLYDAFVSYLKDSTPIYGEERKFALQVLPKILEEHFGYKLCIFERDVSPGGAVVDDVQSFIDRSRRLIIILSKNYISDQVMFELETGLHKALVERKIKVILVEYMPISDFEFLPKSLELLSSHQVVKWKEEKSLPLNSRFWKKLRYAMPAKPPLKNSPALFQHPRKEGELLVHSVSYPSCPC